MFTLNCRGRLLVVDKPVVMGIINTTPDSFYGGSRSYTIDDALHRAEEMLAQGATIADIGGQSTRPGSERVSAGEELARVIPVIEAIHRRLPELVISVDTFYSVVAREAVDAGASLVNDISAGSLDELMIPVVASLRVPYVLMHIKGDPQTMQQQAQYADVTAEVIDYMSARLHNLRQAGINDVIIDPGFGFAKTHAHNFELLKNLSLLSILGCPVLAGISRKGTIYKTLGVSPEDALNGTTVMNTVALVNGASILRVHDVKEAMEAIRLVTAMYPLQ